MTTSAMILLRSLLFYLLLALTTLVLGPAIILTEWWLPPRWSGRLGNVWGLANLSLLKAVCGLGYRIQGLENLPSTGAVVAANHQSAWETIALRGLLPPRQTWVLKRQLLMIPVFGWALWVSKSIAIDRKAGPKSLKKLMKEGITRLEEGRLVVIFPEGTRVTPGEQRKYSAGAGLLAGRSGCPVVPVAHNAGVFWARRGLRKYPGTIDVVFGPPIPTQGLKAVTVTRKVEEWIKARTEQMPQRWNLS